MSDSNIIPFEPRPPEPVSGTSYEVALDDAVSGEIVPVDPPAERGALLPVIPVNLQTLAGVRAEAARQAGRHLHRVKYHGIRSPRYLTLTAVWSVVGAGSLSYRWLHWWLFPV